MINHKVTPRFKMWKAGQEKHALSGEIIHSPLRLSRMHTIRTSWRSDCVLTKGCNCVHRLTKKLTNLSHVKNHGWQIAKRLERGSEVLYIDCSRRWSGYSCQHPHQVARPLLVTPIPEDLMPSDLHRYLHYMPAVTGRNTHTHTIFNLKLKITK